MGSCSTEKISRLKRSKSGSAMKRRHITIYLWTKKWGCIRITHGTGDTDFVIFPQCLSSTFFVWAARSAMSYSLFLVEPKKLRSWSQLVVSKTLGSNTSHQIPAVASHLPTIHSILSPVLAFCTISPTFPLSFVKWPAAQSVQVGN